MLYDRNKPIWYFDYPVTLLYAGWLGRFVQLSADSGEYLHEKVVETIITAIVCFACAIAISIALRIISDRFPVWLLIAVLGSMLFALGYGVVLFVDRSNIDSILSYLLQEPGQVLYRFIIQTAMYSVPLLVLLSSFRGMAYLVAKYRQISLQ